MKQRIRGIPATAAVAMAVLAGMIAPAAATASTNPAPEPGRAAMAPPASTVKHPAYDATPDTTLPRTWKTSPDRAVTVSGDQSGLHILVADSRKAYAWSTVATLSEPGFATDMWVGNYCLTDPGHAMVVYAPREFANTEALMEQGAFAAIVDLDSGKTVKLPFTASLAYFDPSCNSSTHTAVFTEINTKANKTRLIEVDNTGRTTTTAVTTGEVTSAVPTGAGIVAARGSELVQVSSSGAAKALTRTSATPFDLRAGAGGVLFADRNGTTEQIKHLSGSKATTLATGPLGQLGLQSDAEGRTYLTGSPQHVGTLPSSVSLLHAPAAATLSTTAALAITNASSTDLPTQVAHPLSGTPSGPATVEIDTTVPATGKPVDFTVPPAQGGDGAKLSSALRGAGTGAKPSGVRPQSGTSAANSTIDPDRSCSIPRNDPAEQAYQPTPNQVEWAVDMAIRGDLTSSWINQGGWRTLNGLGTVNPQGMFPLTPLAGGGRIPAQILLGILAQESNLWQAEGGALPGQTSSPINPNWYGNPKADPTNPEAIWQINWAKSDCGYGIGQVTDGMRIGQTTLTAAQQKAIALDYTTNIAQSANILASKWNELQNLPTPLTINNNSAHSLEDWFAAIWDYNEGFNAPGSSSTGAWGLGWYNNPANPIYPADRGPFLDGNISCVIANAGGTTTTLTGYQACLPYSSELVDGPSYADAAHPQNWPYEEKVIGWAMAPINTGLSFDDNGNLNNGNTAGYSAAWWNNDYDRVTAKPPLNAFCNTNNACDTSNPPPCETQQIQGCDILHWYNKPVTWKTDCSTSCGNEYLTYKTLRMEPGNGKASAPTCTTSGLPSNALVIDSVSGQVPPMVDGCTKTWTDAGTLGFTFNADSSGNYEGKEDFHQIGGGFGGHFWYAQTRSTTTDVSNNASNVLTPTASTRDQVLAAPQVTGNMAVSGSWKLANPLNAWTRVIVHVPDSGATTQQAIYTIHMGNGTTENRIINTHYKQNTWVPLGVFHFVSGSDFQGVTLTNFAYDGNAASTIAWDAMAFQPLPAKPGTFVVQLGDSYSSGTGVGSYIPNTATGPYATAANIPADTGYNSCLRSTNSWIRQTILPATSSSIGSRSDSYDQTLDFHSVACNGAVTADADPSLDTGTMSFQKDGEYREIPQLYSGDLDANTTLIAMTFGGNDAGFASTVKDCVEFWVGCPADTTVRSNIDAAVKHIAALLSDVRKLAPNARIVVLGYPQIFDTAPACTSVVGVSSMIQLDQWGAYMTQQEQIAVNGSGTGATFQDPEPQFTQPTPHQDCDSPAGINDAVHGPASDDPSDNSCPASSPTGPPWFACTSNESFHPTQLGASLYAKALQAALA